MQGPKEARRERAFRRREENGPPWVEDDASGRNNKQRGCCRLAFFSFLLLFLSWLLAAAAALAYTDTFGVCGERARDPHFSFCASRFGDEMRSLQEGEVDSCSVFFLLLVLALCIISFTLHVCFSQALQFHLGQPRGHFCEVLGYGVDHVVLDLRRKRVGGWVGGWVGALGVCRQ